MYRLPQAGWLVQDLLKGKLAQHGFFQSNITPEFFLFTNEQFPHNNGEIYNVAKVTQALMLSAYEAELRALFINAKQAVAIRVTLTEMGHLQLPSPIQTHNSTMMGVITNTNLPKATKQCIQAFIG